MAFGSNNARRRRFGDEQSARPLRLRLHHPLVLLRVLLRSPMFGDGLVHPQRQLAPASLRHQGQRVPPPQPSIGRVLSQEAEDGVRVKLRRPQVEMLLLHGPLVQRCPPLPPRRRLPRRSKDSRQSKRRSGGVRDSRRRARPSRCPPVRSLVVSFAIRLRSVCRACSALSCVLFGSQSLFTVTFTCVSKCIHDFHGLHAMYTDGTCCIGSGHIARVLMLRSLASNPTRHLQPEATFGRNVSEDMHALPGLTRMAICIRYLWPAIPCRPRLAAQLHAMSLRRRGRPQSYRTPLC